MSATASCKKAVQQISSRAEKTSLLLPQPNHSLPFSPFAYRPCWGNDSFGHNLDKTQVFDNTIYVLPHVDANVLCNKQNIPLEVFQKGGNEPGSRQINAMPKTADVMQLAATILGSW